MSGTMDSIATWAWSWSKIPSLFLDGVKQILRIWAPILCCFCKNCFFKKTNQNDPPSSFLYGFPQKDDRPLELLIIDPCQNHGIFRKKTIDCGGNSNICHFSPRFYGEMDEIWPAFQHLGRWTLNFRNLSLNSWPKMALVPQGHCQIPR